MCGGFAVGDPQHHRLGVGVPAQVPPGQLERVVQIRTLHQIRVDGRQLPLGEPHRVPTEPDDLQSILRKPRSHEMR